MKYKDFQKAAIKKIVAGYESKEKQNRFLVADEVGLGKTIIAKGVLRCLFYFEYLKYLEKKCMQPENEDGTEFTFNVLYLCSNLNIAEQNKSKLGVSKRDRSSLMEEVVFRGKSFRDYSGKPREGGAYVENRTTMLMKKLLDDVSNNSKDVHFQEIKVGDLREECVKIYGEDAIKEKEKGRPIDRDKNLRLNILPITTKTSIKIQGTGHQQERRFIKETLDKLSYLADPNSINEPWLESVLQLEFNNASENNKRKKELLEQFRTELQAVQRKYYNNESFDPSKLKEMDAHPEKYKTDWQNLRQQFALASVEMIKYDFVIMDEFQNFSEILYEANETERTKAYYEDKAAYIYAAMSCVDNKFDKEKNWLKGNYFNNKRGEELSADEKFFWFSELSEAEIWPKDISKPDSSPDIDDLIGTFSELAKKRLENKAVIEKTDVENNKLKSDMLTLVKAVISRDNIDSAVSKAYYGINVNSEPLVFASGLIEKIELEAADAEDGKKKYTKTSVSLYREEALDVNKSGLLQWWQNETFDIRYKRLRDCGNIRWNERYKEIPFRYLLNLHVATKGTEYDTNIPELILNCYIRWVSSDEKVILWQYAYLLTEVLKSDNNRLQYTVEQLEPMRRLLGTYIKNEMSLSEREKKCENAVIDKVFSEECRDDGKYTKILMLSATPFRMYITEEKDGSENADIESVCDFLDTNAQTNPTEALLKYKNQLLQFAREQEKSLEEVKEAKASFQDKMNLMFTRMERFAVLRELVKDWFENQANTSKDEEIFCGGIKELFEYSKQVAEIDNARTVITYAMDAPYMGTFMHGGKLTKQEGGDGYEWKRTFDNKVQNGEVRFEKGSYLFITKDCFERKEVPLGLWHGVYKNALDKLLDLDVLGENVCKDNHPGAARLLWVPSCISRKKEEALKGAFAEHKDYGKTIIFSRLVQVPRMISGISGYEVLRRLIWQIEHFNAGKGANGFDEALQKVREAFTCKDGEQISTYLKLNELLEKVDSKIKKPLMDESKDESVLKTCQEVIQQYYEKYSEKNSKEESDVAKKKVQQLAVSFAENLLDKVLLNRQQGMFAIWASEGFWDGKGVSEKENVQELFIDDCVRKVLDYCKKGCLSEVLQEWLYICWESEQDLGEFLGVGDLSSERDADKEREQEQRESSRDENSYPAKKEKVNCLNFIRTTNLKVSLYEDKDGKLKAVEAQKSNSRSTEQGGDKAKDSGMPIPTFFARCIGMSKDDDKISSVKHLQQAFNAPFAPFVFATTSMGQEGLDFHHYADRIIHWRLPSNPVDFEQREGRINRYHCLALRKKLIEWYGHTDSNDVYQIFEDAFKEAKTQILNGNSDPVANCGLVPDWVLINNKSGEYAAIKRYVPYFYLSKVNEDYHKNLRVLQLYRSVIGQTDPEEVMERLMSSRTPEEVQQLFVDFSPYNVQSQNQTGEEVNSSDYINSESTGETPDTITE